MIAFNSLRFSARIFFSLLFVGSLALAEEGPPGHGGGGGGFHGGGPSGGHTSSGGHPPSGGAPQHPSGGAPRGGAPTGGYHSGPPAGGYRGNGGQAGGYRGGAPVGGYRGGVGAGGYRGSNGVGYRAGGGVYGHGNFVGHVNYNGRTYSQRSYYNSYSHTYVNNYYYRGHWGGFGYSAYCHNWGWGYNWGFFFSPFANPFFYTGWGWYGDPLYDSYYGWYYQPYYRHHRYYADSYPFITDAVNEEYLNEAYQQGVADGQAQVPVNTGLSITEAEESRLQQQDKETMQAFQKQEPFDVTQAFADPQYRFTVDVATEVNDGSCTLREGDLLKVSSTPQPQDTSIHLTVVSTTGNCTRQTPIELSVAVVQRMISTRSEKIDRNLGKLSKLQGQPVTTGNGETPPAN